jgi:hypothetical protein
VKPSVIAIVAIWIEFFILVFFGVFRSWRVGGNELLSIYLQTLSTWCKKKIKQSEGFSTTTTERGDTASHDGIPSLLANDTDKTGGATS